MKKHNVSDPMEAQSSTGVEVSGTTKDGKPRVKKRQLSADSTFGGIEIPKAKL